MNLAPVLPVLVLLSSALPSLLLFFLSDRQARLRLGLYLGGEVLKLLLVAAMLWGIYLGHHYETRLPLLPGVDLLLRASALVMLFLTLSAGLWLLTTIYAIGYLRGDLHQSRFYAFFGLCVTATAGIALAGNLLTFFIFYEILTLVTYPLVVHKGTREALDAGRTYLAYTLSGGVVLLVGVAWLHAVAGRVEFTEGGALAGLEAGWGTLVAIFALLIAGLGVKTALVPLHGWLPAAMVAPTPVSALLHAVAVVKAGAFGVVLVVYEIFGIELCQRLGVLGPLGLVAAVTIVYGSLQALRQDDLKRRLAYSTVSQLAYITLGVAIVGPFATIGGIVHLVHQGIMKITLFFCAGILAETLGIYKVSQMNGVGRRLPGTMVAFSLAAFGMIGLPPFAGFISKWYLGLGAVAAGQLWPIGVLVASTLLNAAYFLPVLHRAWFTEPAGPFSEQGLPGRIETDWLLLLPPLATASLTLFFGLLAGAPGSPLHWAELVAIRELPYELERLRP